MHGIVFGLQIVHDCHDHKVLYLHFWFQVTGVDTFSLVKFISRK